MTLICSKEDVDKLIREMRHWGDDPDLRRIADALPLDLLEAAYVAKLDATSNHCGTPWIASSYSEKLTVMRRVFAAWCRALSSHTLGEFLVRETSHPEVGLVDIDNQALVRCLESRYPPPK